MRVKPDRCAGLFSAARLHIDTGSGSLMSHEPSASLSSDANAQVSATSNDGPVAWFAGAAPLPLAPALVR